MAAEAQQVAMVTEPRQSATVAEPQQAEVVEVKDDNIPPPG
jgi:hypothetical protein